MWREWQVTWQPTLSVLYHRNADSGVFSTTTYRFFQLSLPVSIAPELPSFFPPLLFSTHPWRITTMVSNACRSNRQWI